MNRDYIKTKVPGLVKDSTSGAFININDVEYNQVMKEMKNSMELKKANEQLCDLRDELSEIKNLLQEVQAVMKDRKA